MRTQPTRLCTIALAAMLSGALLPMTQAADVFVDADISTSEIWTADNTYILTRVIYVDAGATLTIEPGTVIRGEPEETENDPGTLVVARGAKLRALGTALKPVIFTNLDDDNLFANSEPDPDGPYSSVDDARPIVATWGGVIILGRGYVANGSLAGPDATKQVQIEGLDQPGNDGLYGNCAASPLSLDACDDDDSGTLSYVSIRYGGFNLSPDNEINGLTLGGVGRETDMHHIEVFQNKDDGIEFFGGAANLKYAVVTAAGDDGLDFDEGWRGKVQHLFVLQGTPGTDKSDKGGEFDGGNSPDGSQPFAIPTIYNATFIGLGGNGASSATVNDPAKAYTGKATNTGLHIRDNAGGRIYNSFVGNFGGSGLIIEGASGNPTGPNTSGQRAITAYAPSSGNCSVTVGTVCSTSSDCPGGEVCVLHYQSPDSDFQLELQDNVFWCNGTADLVPTSPTDAAAAGGDSKDHFDPGIFTNAALDNVYVPCADALPIRGLERGVGLPNAPNPIVSIDPLPAAGSPLLATNRMPPADGFFEPAPYRGAFGRSNWTTGWTATSRLGYFPTCAGSSDGPAPDEVQNLSWNTDTTVLSWDAGQLSGLMGVQLFDVLRVEGTSSAAAADFSTADCVETADADTSARDSETPQEGETFFYLVRAGNPCGEGSLGSRSSGSERSGASCP